MRRTHLLILMALAALAIVAYLPVFSQPLVEDDYPCIEQARVYGPGLQMLADGMKRPRATFWLQTYLLDRIFGPAPLPFYAAAVALHVLCTWLVYALGCWSIVGWRVGTAAAAFFAVHEGHQEAVMWYSATNESLQFLFGVAALVCWIRFVDQRGGLRWYGAALGLFLLALFSMESAAIFAALLLLPLWALTSRRRAALLWLPFPALAAADAWLIVVTRSSHFEDNRFSFYAPVWITLPESFARLLWIWGFFSLFVVVLLKARRHRQLILTALAWIPIALLPYSFLTYMHRVPSRLTYLASLGLAWIVGAGFCDLYARVHQRRRQVAALVAAVILVCNIGLLWTTKRRQFLQRAAPAEALVALARRTGGPIYMRCTTGAIDRAVFEAAVRLRTGRMPLLWDRDKAGAAAAEFCWERSGQPPR